MLLACDLHYRKALLVLSPDIISAPFSAAIFSSSSYNLDDPSRRFSFLAIFPEREFSFKGKRRVVRATLMREHYQLVGGKPRQVPRCG